MDVAKNIDKYMEDEPMITEPEIPIAIGPCYLYRRPEKTLEDCNDQVCKVYSCCCTDKPYSVMKVRGAWQACFLSLYADSTMKFHDGANYTAPVITSVKLEDLYRDLSFGRDLVNVPGQSEVPETVTKSWDAVMAVPDVPYCNGNINWVDFSSQNSLNKWLVAICRSLPETALKARRSTHSLTTDHHDLFQLSPFGPSLKSHISLFFPRKTFVPKRKLESSIPLTSSNDTGQHAMLCKRQCMEDSSFSTSFGSLLVHD